MRARRGEAQKKREGGRGRLCSKYGWMDGWMGGWVDVGSQGGKYGLRKKKQAILQR